MQLFKCASQVDLSLFAPSKLIYCLWFFLFIPAGGQCSEVAAERFTCMSVVLFVLLYSMCDMDIS